MLRHSRLKPDRHIRRLVPVALVCAVGLASSLLVPSAAHALGCPAPEALSSPGVLKETPAQTQRVTDLLATGDDDNRIHTIADDLRARYPGIQNAEIINYLMAAYCRVVAQLSGLGEKEKQARMDRFVSQLSRIIY
jgi:hypothetical protein